MKEQDFGFLMKWMAQKMLMLEAAYGEDVMQEILDEKNYDALNDAMMGRLKEWKGLLFRYDEETTASKLVDAKGKPLQ